MTLKIAQGLRLLDSDTDPLTTTEEMFVADVINFISERTHTTSTKRGLVASLICKVRGRKAPDDFWDIRIHNLRILYNMFSVVKIVDPEYSLVCSIQPDLNIYEIQSVSTASRASLLKWVLGLDGLGNVLEWWALHSNTDIRHTESGSQMNLGRLLYALNKSEYLATALINPKEERP